MNPPNSHLSAVAKTLTFLCTFVFCTFRSLFWDKQLSGVCVCVCVCACVCVCVAAGLLPCFSVSAAFRSPGDGGLRMWAQGKPWSWAPDTEYNLRVCLRSCSSIQWDCSCQVSLCLIFIPLLWWDTNSQLLTPDTGSWKTRSDLKHIVCARARACARTIQQPTAKQGRLCHNTVVSWKVFSVIFISLVCIRCLISSRCPLPDRKTDSAWFMKRLQVHDGWKEIWETLLSWRNRGKVEIET